MYGRLLQQSTEQLHYFIHINRCYLIIDSILPVKTIINQIKKTHQVSCLSLINEPGNRYLDLILLQETQILLAIIFFGVILSENSITTVVLTLFNQKNRYIYIFKHPF